MLTNRFFSNFFEAATPVQLCTLARAIRCNAATMARFAWAGVGVSAAVPASFQPLFMSRQAFGCSSLPKNVNLKHWQLWLNFATTI